MIIRCRRVRPGRIDPAVPVHAEVPGAFPPEGEFVARRDVRMAAQDLFDECSSRVRHAEHEEGTAPFAPQCGIASKKTDGESGDQPVDGCVAGSIIGLERLSLQAVPIVEMPDRLTVLYRTL